MQKRKSCICTLKIRRRVQINGFWVQPCKCTLEKKPDTTLLLHNRTVGIAHILKLRLTFEETSNPIFSKRKNYPDKTLLYPSFKSRDVGQLAKNSSGSVITRAKQIRIKSLDVHISFDMSSLVSRQYLLPSHTIRHIHKKKERSSHGAILFQDTFLC